VQYHGKAYNPSNRNNNMTKHVKEYEVYAQGGNNKIEVKTTIKAREPEEAERIAKIFCKVAGVTFSHTKVKV